MKKRTHTYRCRIIFHCKIQKECVRVEKSERRFEFRANLKHWNRTEVFLSVWSFLMIPFCNIERLTSVFVTPSSSPSTYISLTPDITMFLCCTHTTSTIYSISLFSNLIVHFSLTIHFDALKIFAHTEIEKKDKQFKSTRHTNKQLHFSLTLSCSAHSAIWKKKIHF